jgi:hypothetical protein
MEPTDPAISTARLTALHGTKTAKPKRQTNQIRGRYHFLARVVSPAEASAIKPVKQREYQELGRRRKRVVNRESAKESLVRSWR